MLKGACLIIVSFLYSVSLAACDATFFIISDLHLNPALKAAMPLTPSRDGTDLDINTFNLFFDRLKNHSQKAKINGVITLGDFVGHGTSTNARENISRFLYEKFEHFELPIYYDFGNNDSLVGNYQAYEKDGKSPYRLLKSINPALTSGFVDSENIAFCKDEQKTPCLYHQTPSLGHYSVYLAPGLRLISFNSVVLNGDHLTNDQQDAAAALNWLRDEFSDSLQAGDSVLLAMHVPPGVDLYTGNYHFREKYLGRPTYEKAFLNIIHQALDEKLNLIAILAGHTHQDELHLLSYQGQVVPVFVNPGLSTSHGNAAGFKSLCLQQGQTGWRIGGLNAYSYLEMEKDFVQYSHLPDDLCRQGDFEACMQDMLTNKERLHNYAKKVYFANNQAQKRAVKFKVEQLYDF
jgi:predicted phosphodiesterase